METFKILVATIGVILLVAWGVISLGQHMVDTDPQIERLESEQATLIALCSEKGGVPSIGHRGFGFPKTFLIRCDFPQETN